MKTCSKSAIYLTILTSVACVLLILINLRQNSNDKFVKIIKDDDAVPIKFHQKNPKPLGNFDVKYVMQAEPCKNDYNLLAVIIVTSYFGHVETRASMRTAFTDEELKKLLIKRVFLLGIAPNDKYTRQNAIEDEQRKFGDLLQGNFVEAYRNLTYKHLMGLKWASEKCSQAKYIIKMDDDVVFNVNGVARLLTDVKLPKNLLAGYILKNMPTIREPHNKWYVTQEEFGEKVYPNFVSGWFYVTNPSTASNLVRVANAFNYFWIDDAFITGIIARELKVEHYDLDEYFITNPEHTLCCYQGMVESRVQCEFLIGPNGGDNNLFYKFNRAIEKCSLYKCKKRSVPLNKTCKINYNSHRANKGNAVVEDFRLF